MSKSEIVMEKNLIGSLLFISMFGVYQIIEILHWVYRHIHVEWE